MKDISKFIKANNFKLGHFGGSHKTYLVEKQKNKSRWFCKELAENKHEAIREVVAQEFFRLLYPPSPKTRWAKEGDNYYVLSKEIPQFKAYFFSEFEETIKKEEDKYKRYTHINGLLSVQVISLILGEVDFKIGNVGVNSENQVIKIDGGWSFPTEKGYDDSYMKKNINFTKKDIQALPIVKKYRPYNWLDFIKYNKNLTKYFRNKNSSLFIFSQKYPSFFEAERNKTILFICSLPDVLINAFTKSYDLDDSEAKILADFIIERRNKLQNIVEKIPSYVFYRASNQAKEDIETYISYLRSFKTFGKKILLAEIENFNIEINTKDYILISNFYRQFKDDIFIIGLILKKDEFFNKITEYSSPLVEIIKEYISHSSGRNRIEVHQALIKFKSQLTKLVFLNNDLLISEIEDCIKALEDCIKALEIISNKRLNQPIKDSSVSLTNNFAKGQMFSLVNKRKYPEVLSSVEQDEDELNRIASK